MSGEADPLGALGASALLAALGDPIFILDASGRVRSANLQAEKLLGIAAQDFIGQPFLDLVSESDLLSLTGLESALGAEIERNLGILLRQSVDGCVQVNATVSRIALRAGEPSGIVIACRDAGTMQEVLSEASRMAAKEGQRADLEARARDEAERRERRQIEEGQARKLASIGQLAAGVAHEINTPIQAMSANLSFLRDASAELIACLRACELRLGAQELPPASALAELADAIGALELDELADELSGAFAQALDGAQRVTGIIRALQDFARPSGGQRGPVRLREAIETAVTLARSWWAPVAELVVDCAGDLPAVPCVADELKQVLLNLLINAAHAIEDRVRCGDASPGRIRVSADCAADCAQIRVEDNGVGIPAENLGKIFDPFFTTKVVGRGSGQGLSVAYASIVVHHGGALEVQSEPGRGSVFLVRLPLDSRAP